MGLQASKVLTPNDLGLNGTHQAGICVPRKAALLEVFPPLNPKLKNPREILRVTAEPTGEEWEFCYIYYNNRFFGGTRNEYRLTGTTPFLRKVRATVGDEIAFEQLGRYRYRTWLIRENHAKDGAGFQFTNTGALILGGGWKVIHTS